MIRIAVLENLKKKRKFGSEFPLVPYMTDFDHLKADNFLSKKYNQKNRRLSLFIFPFKSLLQHLVVTFKHNWTSKFKTYIDSLFGRLFGRLIGRLFGRIIW